MIDTSSDKLLALLNTEFTPQIALSDVTINFSNLTSDDNPEWDTKLTVTGIPGKGYYGSVDVFYRRIGLEVLDTSAPLRKEGTFNIDEITTMLNGMTDSFISRVDLDPVVIPVLSPGDSKPLTLTAHPESLGWKGTTTVTLKYGRPTMEEVITRRQLSILRPPGGKLEYPAAWAMIYYTDFTSFRDALKIDPITGLYSDQVALLNITRQLGLPSWKISGAVDKLTSAVPGSNPAFARVVVQELIDSLGMAGPLYFHYNLLDGE